MLNTKLAILTMVMPIRVPVGTTIVLNFCHSGNKGSVNIKARGRLSRFFPPALVFGRDKS